MASIAALPSEAFGPASISPIIGLRDEAVIRYTTSSLTCFELSLFEMGATLAPAILAQLAPPGERRRLADGGEDAHAHSSRRR